MTPRLWLALLLFLATIVGPLGGYYVGRKQLRPDCLIPPQYWEPHKPAGRITVGYFCVWIPSDEKSSRCVWKILGEE